MVVAALFLGASSPRPVKVLMAGDSTMADKTLTRTVTDSLTGETFTEPFLERGWGQLLPEFLSEKAVVENYARNGRSTRTFVEEGLWTKLMDNAGKGDFVIIQFAHNDGVITKKSYVNPAQFRLNLVAFVNEARQKGVFPILCTPVARRKFGENGILEKTHGEYPDIIRSVACDYGVALIDMETLTSDWLQREGVEASNGNFHKIPKGVSKLFPDGLDDNTHFNERGARKVAQLFLDEVKKQHFNDFVRLMK